MGTVIDQVALTRARWRHRHSALHLAVKAADDCLHRAGRNPDDVDMLINAGIYRDRNLAEPALAALIQQDIGANPENPHADSHGTFSFDITNGICGLLSGLQIVDGFLKSRAIDCALVVASDADPGHGMSEHFPFSPTGSALLCTWRDADVGLRKVHWTSAPATESSTATVGLVDGRNLLTFDQSDEIDELFAEAASRVADKCFRESGLTLSDIDVVVAAPAHRGYRAALAERLGLHAGAIVVAEDEEMHTASLAAALQKAIEVIPQGGLILLVAAAAGITAGATIYQT